MDRREFFKLGFLQLKDRAQKSAPDIIRKELTPTLLDVSILTEHESKATQLVDALLPEHFGKSFLRLRQSRLSGQFRGGIVLFEGEHMRDYHDGASLFYAALLDIEKELQLGEIQNNPVLLRYVNRVPAFSRTADIYHRSKLVNAVPLFEEAELEIQGDLGPLVLTVKEKRLAVSQSSCTGQTCCGHPPIITPGQRITCVPNRISIAIGMQA